MKGGVTRKLTDTVAALDKKQLKKALYLTEGKKTERQHEFVEEAARTCLANKGNHEVCEAAIKGARNKVQDTVSVPIDDTSMEGLEDYLSPENPKEEETPQPAPEKAEVDLYEDCPECHVAVAASEFAEACALYPEEAKDACKEVSEKLEDETTEPVDWIKTMIGSAEKAEGEAKAKMVGTLSELGDYLERKNSPWLEQLDNKQEVDNGKTTTVIPAHTEVRTEKARIT